MLNIPNDEIAWYVLIHTNAYAGNFERELVAFITGLIGECGVGEEEAKIARDKLHENVRQWFTDNVVYENDGEGVWRPAILAANPNYWGDGYSNVFPHDVDIHAAAVGRKLAAYKKRRKEDLLKYHHSEEYIKAKAAEIDAYKVTQKYPVYNSVAFRIKTLPPLKVLKAITDRAELYTIKDWGSPMYEFDLERIEVVKYRTRVTRTKEWAYDLND